MRALFVIGPDFSHWPIAISKEIKKQRPNATFCSLVIAEKNPTYEFVRNQTNPTISPSFMLDDLEKIWLAPPYNINELSYYESILGDNIINELIIADRYLGNEYVKGGNTMNTPLTSISRSHDKQLCYINGLLNFLFNFLKEQKPNIILAPAVASAPTLALPKVAQFLNIEFRVLNASRFESIYILDKSPYLDAPDIEDLYKKAIKNPEVLKDLLPIAKEKLAKFRNKPSAPEYWSYWYNLLKKPPTVKDTLALIYRTLEKRPPETLVYPYPFSRLFLEWRRYLLFLYYKFKKNFFDDFSSLEGKDFVYYPLHHDPECSTMVLAPNYTNQLEVIERLSKSLPVGYTLAVKDHYPMLGNRPWGFYKTIKSFPRVKLISPFVSGFTMILRAKLTTVITGTAGFEALLLKKPALCLGKIHYHTIKKGFIYCNNLNELPEKIRQALNVKPASDQELSVYLACLIKEGFDCPSHLLGIHLTNETVQNNKKFVEIIAQKLIFYASKNNAKKI